MTSTADPEMRALFACPECAQGDCWNCVHFAGEWCPHRCFWLYGQGDTE